MIKPYSFEEWKQRNPEVVQGIIDAAELCRDCDGNGWVHDELHDESEECSSCRGTGLAFAKTLVMTYRYQLLTDQQKWDAYLAGKPIMANTGGDLWPVSQSA